MTRAKPLFLALCLAVAAPAGARAQGGIQYDKIEIRTDKVAPNLYMLSGSENVDPGHPDGAGGRIGVLAGPDGIFMVDSQYVQVGDRVLAAVRRIDPGPIRFLVNIAGSKTRLIPGHGTYINKTDITPYRTVMLDVQTKVQQLIAQGKTLQEVLAAKVTSAYDAKVPGGLLPAGPVGSSADRFVSMVYSQLGGK